MGVFGHNYKPTIETIIDYTENIPIEVIASFRKDDGAIRPLWFRYTFPDSSRINIEIKELLYFKESADKKSCNYHCNIINNNLKREVILSYYKDKNCWVLKKPL